MMSKQTQAKKAGTLSATLFKLTGPAVRLKTDDKKKRCFYFEPVLDAERARQVAEKEAPSILQTSLDKTKIGTPSLKYEFYCIYNATMRLRYLRVRNEEVGVNEQVIGVAIGNSVFMPKKGAHGNAISLDLVELIEITRQDSLILDGVTGDPANTFESLLKGPGKRPATPAWISKATVVSGKFNSIEKVTGALEKAASSVPKDAKRVVEHTIEFSQLDGFYVPFYHVNISAGDNAKTLRINAVNGTVLLKV